MIKIKISELKHGFEKVFEQMIFNGTEEVEIPHDFYWNINEEEKYNIKSAPQSLDLGQLSDDNDELRKIVSGASEPLPFSLVWLSSLATAVGESKVI